MPEGTKSILSSRTLPNAHARLSDLLKPGMAVLDVGCGNGAITQGIAERVQPGGRVVGVDINQKLIEEARIRTSHTPNLTFALRDIYDLGYDAEFDLTTASRVLQWLQNPLAAISQMVKATAPRGRVIVLDYNHEKVAWDPAPPKSARHFYDAFLKWRLDAGMDNAIADSLEALFHRAGLNDVQVTAQHESTRRGDPDFETRIGIWAAVMASRGRQVVADGFITEEERALAEEEYSAWMKEEAQSQSLYLLAVEGTVAG